MKTSDKKKKKEDREVSSKDYDDANDRAYAQRLLNKEGNFRKPFCVV